MLTGTIADPVRTSVGASEIRYAVPCYGAGKGGSLHQQAKLKQRWTCSSGCIDCVWALRFGFLRVLQPLSGMSNENRWRIISKPSEICTVKRGRKAVIAKAQEALKRVRRFSNACRYCWVTDPKWESRFRMCSRHWIPSACMEKKTARKIIIKAADIGKTKAEDCVQCGRCESVCPQHLPIIDLLKEASESLTCRWRNKRIANIRFCICFRKPNTLKRVFGSLFTLWEILLEFLRRKDPLGRIARAEKCATAGEMWRSGLTGKMECKKKTHVYINLTSLRFAFYTPLLWWNL